MAAWLHTQKEYIYAVYTLALVVADSGECHDVGYQELLLDLDRVDSNHLRLYLDVCPFLLIFHEVEDTVALLMDLGQVDSNRLLLVLILEYQYHTFLVL